MVSTFKWPILSLMLMLAVLVCVCNCLPNKYQTSSEDSYESKLIENSDENTQTNNIEEKMEEINKMYEMLNFFRFLKKYKMTPEEFINNFLNDNTNQEVKRSTLNSINKFKRNCLGLGMGYQCHAYAITKFAEQQKLLSHPRGPGRR